VEDSLVCSAVVPAAHWSPLTRARSALRACALACLLAAGACQSRAAVSDLDGQRVDPLATHDAPTVLVFVSSECPISNRYAPELVRLEHAFAPRGVRFWLVYPSPLDSVARIRTHLHDFGFDMRALRDGSHVLVQRAKAEVTPEVAVFRSDGALAYHGRIDDRYVAFGVAKTEPSVHDLENALRAVLAGQTVRPDHNDAVGCSLDE
jgi:hypothetical protein